MDDDGLPHCLEHLVFLGSEDYAYTGILDGIANQCMASGTNAWTGTLCHVYTIMSTVLELRKWLRSVVLCPDSDHTCYTYETAGQDGFCCLLPIYLDHIFFPTLSVRKEMTQHGRKYLLNQRTVLQDSGFLTEVHHITREGKDGGVVYSEMLAKQHSPENRTTLELTEALYPRTSPYHYNSGGTLKNLRTTTTNHKVP